MAPRTDQTSRSHGNSCPGQLRQPFSDLTINAKPERYSAKICKTRSKPSGNPLLWHRPYIYSKLQTIPNLSNRTPCLRRQANDAQDEQYELQYPVYRIWRLIGDPTLPTLSIQDLRRLRNALIEDISRLYDARIAYDPDLTTLTVVKKLNQRERVATFVPFIDTFDFDDRVGDEATLWADLMQRKINTANAQFEVLELLAELSESRQISQFQADLQPDVVAQIFQRIHPRDDQRNLVIRRVARYSPELGRLVIQEARRYVCELPRRTGLARESVNESTRDYCSTVAYILGLMDKYESGRQVELGDLGDRAAISILYAALLIHLHAKTNLAIMSRGLLDMSGNATAESYTSYEGFQTVTAAYSQAMRAIHCFEENGGQLDDGSEWILRTPP
ncbi:hypothetical protein F5X98DRAFT_389764 [Xylaria grammica]|nr:hypothetical protein F5X98DRAFT_389764 [Xylaria grammica]